MKLIIVSKEIGVEFNTVVEYLHSWGFDIEVKPAAIVSEDVYEALLKEFKSSYIIKHKADKIILGNRVKSHIEKLSKSFKNSSSNTSIRAVEIKTSKQF